MVNSEASTGQSENDSGGEAGAAVHGDNGEQ